ncbi:phospho-acceptor domain-containing protein [Yoonia sediminilitoris]|uniref:histidine kinase n=1 Tax=Yoonia sediminilitoris TaxID=1286148 RepID=A0A2T6KIC4_9RHOB|nr:phospho-acceptor domain-containing protein [Yoonia sediminilitoris]RCW96067.1 phospho-acceptor domain-containing protein [Yoonia sediminilitoris]
MLSISEGSELIYDEYETTEPMFDPDPMFSDQILIDLYGRNRGFDIRTNLTFRQENSYSQLTFILFAGLLTEALIVFCLVVMARARTRAVRYAKHVTAALRQESAKLAETNRYLSSTNDELEQFSYAVSHNLKTPIRGIGGLTEMIEEDLEDYFASVDANPGVRSNLARIHERIDRMSRLTSSIMEYSRIGNQGDTGDPLDIKEAIDSMRVDFDLAPEQLQLTDDVGTIHVDTTNLRRVLENIVGNAVKYHVGTAALRINVRALRVGDRARLVVSDNGPGIDPKFHDRIFDVFQTLRTGDTPKSRGIGLSIVKKVVEFDGGKVELVSSIGTGAAFGFDWPIRKQLQSHAQPSEAA